jgi:hypothetical protein
VSPVRYELGFYTPEDGIPHSHRHEDLKTYITLTGCSLEQRRNVCPVRYELGLNIFTVKTQILHIIIYHVLPFLSIKTCHPLSYRSNDLNGHVSTQPEGTTLTTDRACLVLR